MNGGCLVIQGPPGTGKTYTASCMIDSLLAAGKKVGVTSNSHKAVVNLLKACGDAARGTSVSTCVGSKSAASDWAVSSPSNPGLRWSKPLLARCGCIFRRDRWWNGLAF